MKRVHCFFIFFLFQEVISGYTSKCEEGTCSSPEEYCDSFSSRCKPCPEYCAQAFDQCSKVCGQYLKSIAAEKVKGSGELLTIQVILGIVAVFSMVSFTLSLCLLYQKLKEVKKSEVSPELSLTPPRLTQEALSTRTLSTSLYGSESPVTKKERIPSEDTVPHHEGFVNIAMDQSSEQGPYTVSRTRVL